MSEATEVDTPSYHHVHRSLRDLSMRIEARINMEVDESVNQAMRAARAQSEAAYLSATAGLVGRQMDVKVTDALKDAEEVIGAQLRKILRDKALNLAVDNLVGALPK